MATKNPSGHVPPQHGEDGYEHRDANVHSLYMYGLTLAILIAIVMFAMVGTYHFFAKIESLGPPASPFENVRVLPPQPRLQVNPSVDLKSYCELEQQQLTTYGWMDHHNGFVRIPVDRAMEMVLQKGLPSRPAEQASADSASAIPGGSTSAPMAMG
ncbi:MAG TPA: hypothetical protein VK795_02055, partial [Terriglobales bacterium]|nr:hypothetical protein [Terriglobales bacterium]